MYPTRVKQESWRDWDKMPGVPVDKGTIFCEVSINPSASETKWDLVSLCRLPALSVSFQPQTRNTHTLVSHAPPPTHTYILTHNYTCTCVHVYTHTNTHTQTLLFLTEKLSPTPVASPVSTFGQGAEKPHLMNLVGGSKDATGRCQSREGAELVWKLDLRIAILGHINADIIELEVRTEAHSLSSQSALCTLSPEHRVTLSHSEIPQKLLDNFVPLHRALQSSEKTFPIFKPLSSLNLHWLTPNSLCGTQMKCLIF